MSFFKSLLFEKYCHYCGKVDETICLNCLNSIFNSYSIREINNKKVLYFFNKDPKIMELIVSYKDKQIYSLGPLFSFITFIGLEILTQNDSYVVVNVPTSSINIKRRGNDPIAKMVEQACFFNKSKYQYRNNLITNYQNRLDQVGLDYKQRKLNLANSFKVTKIEKRPIILVDDLITTGVSLSESIKALESKGNTVQGCVVIASN
jgi:predicted amidophosphoribosyltransferase